MIGIDFESLENGLIPPPPSDEMSEDDFVTCSVSPTRDEEGTEGKEASLDTAIGMFTRSTKTAYNKNRQLIMKNWKIDRYEIPSH